MSAQSPRAIVYSPSSSPRSLRCTPSLSPRSMPCAPSSSPRSMPRMPLPSSWSRRSRPANAIQAGSQHNSYSALSPKVSLPLAFDSSQVTRRSSYIGSYSPHVRHHFVSPMHRQADSPMAVAFFDSRPQSRLQHQPSDAAAGLPDVDASPASESSDQDIPETTMNHRGLVIISELSRSNHSSVHLVQKAATNTELGGLRCVKRFAKSVNCEERSSVAREFDIMRKFGGHPCILEAFSLFQDGSFFYIEMPYCEGGVLNDFKAQAIAANVSLTEGWWSNVFKSCLEALAHLHTHDIVHCDVKEANLMAKTLDYSQPEIVLVDFGIAQDRSHVCIDEGKKPDIIYGTPGYIPPEVWSSKIWTPAGDMFSLGVVISQLLMDKFGLFTEGTTCLKEIKQATQTREPPFDSIGQIHLRSLARNFLEKVPSSRPRAVDALSESYSISWRVSDDGSPEQANVLPETTIHEDLIADGGKEDGSSSISTACGLDSPSLASSCSDC